MYDYRNMTPSQRREAVEYRRLRERPWHSPPHWKFQGLLQFMISGACYEHHHIIGLTPERMTECEGLLLELCDQFATNVYAWCLLPNHYHLLLQTDQLQNLRKALGQLHGRTSFKWNGEDSKRGRHCWYNAFERRIRSDLGGHVPKLEDGPWPAFPADLMSIAIVVAIVLVWSAAKELVH